MVTTQATDVDERAALQCLRIKCEEFKKGPQTAEDFEKILTWAKTPPYDLGLLEFKQCLAELDPDVPLLRVPAWAETARADMWSEKLRKRNENLTRLRSYQPPPKLIHDEFGLVRFWPCFMEVLRPFPEGAEELLVLGNKVYMLVAGKECFSAKYSTKQNKYLHEYDTFEVSSCAVHFRVVSRLIRTLEERKPQGLGEHAGQLLVLLESFCEELIKVRRNVARARGQ